MTIIIEKLHNDVLTPERASSYAAGYDARAYIKGRDITSYWQNNELYLNPAATRDADFIVMAPQQRVLIPLGFKASIPVGYEAQIRSRSGLALKSGIVVFNQPGTIDSDYAGEWGVILHNTSTVPFTVNHGDRVAQIVLHMHEITHWYTGVVTGQRGGFGSTGV